MRNRLRLLARTLCLAFAAAGCQRADTETATKSDREAVKAGNPAVAKKMGHWGGPPGVDSWPARYVTAAAFSPDGRYIAAGDTYNVVTLYDSGGAKCWSTGRAKYVMVRRVAFAADGKALFSAHSDGTLNCWDATSGRLAWSRTEAAGRFLIDDNMVEPLVALVVCPDRKHLLVASASKFLLCHVSTGKVEHSWRGGAGLRGGLALAPDGKLALATDPANGPQITGAAVLWDVAKGRELCFLEPKGGGAQWAVAFSPDGKQGVTGGVDGAVRLWEVATRKLRHTLHLHGDPVSALALSPDGRLGLTGEARYGGDREAAVLLWEVRSGKVVHRLAGLRGEVQVVAFSADGKRALASSGPSEDWARKNGSLLVWDVASGNVVARPAFPKEYGPQPFVPGSRNTRTDGSALATRKTGP